MTLAWFRAAPPDAMDPHDDTAALIDALRMTYDIDVVTAADAHDFVWRNFRARYDVCVYEPGDEVDGAFIWPYLVHNPGVLVLRTLAHRVSRAILASRLVVVPHASSAQTLQDLYPEARIRDAPIGIREPQPSAGHIVVDLQWSSTSMPRALAGLAAGKAVVVLETEATADWPALNPQTWRPRGSPDAAPIVVSLDPRDEQHSLMLAMTRLETDKALREDLGAAAREWWASHATVEHAVAAWKPILQEAMTLPAPAVAAKDGTERARDILAAFGVSVDFLQPSQS
jgi:hypothetical protein